MRSLLDEEQAFSVADSGLVEVLVGGRCVFG